MSNTDRNLSNNQIERLNKGIKNIYNFFIFFYNKYYIDCFYNISNRKANIVILSLSTFSKYAFTFKHIFECLMKI